MSCPFQEARRGEDVVIAIRHPVSFCSSLEAFGQQTFVSTNLLIVAKMSWCPDTSSKVFGLYFSTLVDWVSIPFRRPIICSHTMVDCPRPLPADLRRFFSPLCLYCLN